jgi:hypothetical protein
LARSDAGLAINVKILNPPSAVTLQQHKANCRHAVLVLRLGFVGGRYLASRAGKVRHVGLALSAIIFDHSAKPREILKKGRDLVGAVARSSGVARSSSASFVQCMVIAGTAASTKAWLSASSPLPFQISMLMPIIATTIAVNVVAPMMQRSFRTSRLVAAVRGTVSRRTHSRRGVKERLAPELSGRFHRA